MIHACVGEKVRVQAAAAEELFRDSFGKSLKKTDGFPKIS